MVVSLKYHAELKKPRMKIYMLSICLHLYKFLGNDNWVKLDLYLSDAGHEGGGVNEFEGTWECFGVDGNVL